MLTFLTLIALLIWIGLTLGRAGYWRADQRLERCAAPAAWPAIAIVIPARDEAATIAEAVSAHMNCDYTGALNLILVDDGSSDATAEIAERAAQTSLSANRSFEIVTPPPLEHGWIGKLWAIHHGLKCANERAPSAKYILFADADIVLSEDALSRLTAKAEAQDLALTSLMARLDASDGWGPFLIPAFIYFFQQLYPFARANNVYDNTAAAAGGCMLIHKGALDAIGGVEAIKGELIDDCALARVIKDISPQTKIWIGLADSEAISKRDNSSFGSVWSMVTRTAFAQLHYSNALLAGTIAAMALVYLIPPYAVLFWAWHGSGAAAMMGLGAWALMSLTYLPTLKLYHRPAWESAGLPAAGLIYAVMTFDGARRYWTGRGGQWKGRSYQPPSARLH